MKKNEMKLQDVLQRILSQGAPMTILTDPKKVTYTPDEVSKIALDGYLMGLCDVLDFIDGNPSGLEQLLTNEGKLVAVDTNQPLFVFTVPREEVQLGESESETPS